MINQMKMGLVALLGVVIWGLTPGVVHAANTHAQACNVCHRSSASPRSMANLCVVCHIKTETNTVARFDVGTASNTLGHNDQAGTDSGAETTHNWGGFSTKWDPAGSTYPPTTFYSSRYSISTKRITCTICHDPHGVTGPNYMVRAAIAGDVLCQQCHSSWFILNDSNDANPVNDTNALLTHPVVTDYATFAAANPTDYNPTPANASNGGSGEVRLVAGAVSCTSCHGTHYADSSSETTDGTSAYNDSTMAIGDGNILRADGPLRMTGTPALPGPRNGATGTAQLRSNLCQSCHKIELHGQGVSGDHRIGCLDCHGGHAYNNGVPNAYILNKMTPDAVPTRPDRVNGISVQVTFNNFPNGASTRITWADEDEGGTEGFCEKCHGDVNSVDMVQAAEAHGVADTNECDVCHKHNDPANLYAFNRDASAATCGQCHGFPPYLNVRGDVGNDPDGTGGNPPLGTLGGYGWNYVDLPAYDYVSSTTHEKNEEQTGHMVHAGADLPTSPAGAGDWYFVGNSGVDNCKVCHGPDAGTTAGNHRINQANTFRDLPFDGIAKTGGMVPAYKTGAPNIWTCSNVYCHTNGAPYIEASRATLTRNYSFTNVTPAWDQANGGGFNAIYGNANRCQFCHGNNTTTMTNKSNSAAHQAHIGAATTLNMGKVFDCKLCHVSTAGSPSALAVGAMDGRNGVGKHVNGLIDVDFETGATPNTLPNALIGSTYTAGTGVCSTYCHNVTGAGGAMAADWDVTTDMQCDSCHGGLDTDIAGNGGYGAIATDSHPLHVTAANGPRLACTVCHGANANIGKHGTHFDGDFDFTAGVCDTCHGYDLAQGEALPVWGDTPYTDPDPSKRDDYCIACHTGTTTTPVLASGGIAAGAPAKSNALSTGHGKPSGTYPLSGNNAANRACTACHDSSAAGHFDGISGDDKRLLLGNNGFPVAYSTIADKNNYCGACHGTTPGHSLPSTRTGINTHQGKACIGCHDPHGDSNRSMILTNQSTQNAKDTTTGKFFGNVSFIAQIDAFSYDEDEGAAGNADEDNANDICATCHTTAGGSAHNNQENLPTSGTHNQGSNCLTICHNAHNDAVETNAFGGGAGTACNDCHGYPPATGDIRHTAAKIGAHELHASSLLNVGGAEASDCEVCHPGATGYGLSASGTHMDSSIGGATTLAAGMAGGTATCTNSCHLSSATVDGYWTDTTKAGYSGNGLNCNACHYAANVATATGANNIAAGSKQLSAVHNEHFDKSKGCAECHDVSYSSTIVAIPGGALGLTHISGSGSDGTLAYYQNRAQALPDEATVGSLTRPSMTYSGGAADGAGSNNTCSNGIDVGCHATGSPDWDVTIPATSAGCIMCHTGTSLNTVDPTSSLHAVVPTVTGKQHSTGFTYNAGANTADCLTCHTASPTITAADHINGTFNASIGADAAGSGGQKITLVAGLGYADAVVPTCNVSITGCHTAKTAGRSWLYKWHNNGAAINGSQCDGCHGMWSAWNGGVVAHRSGSEAETVHGTGALYKCRDCHGLESASGYPYTTTSNDWKPTELGSTLHGDGDLNINLAGSTAFNRSTYAGCTGCHSDGDGVAAGQHAFTLTTWTTPTFSGDPIVVSCSSCHGGATIVGANSNYWPDGANTLNDNGTADNRGAHLIHITRLATTVMGQNITELLTDNAGVGIGGWITATADAKQRELCSYCHLTPIGTNAGHGVTYPAQLTSMFNLWNKGADNVAYSTADGTCATSDCHYNKTTPTVPNYGWYGGQASACVICHTNGASDTTHTEHLGGGFGRVINCTDCHVAGTTSTTVPSIGHINGTFKGDGGTIIDGTTKTYSGGTCGTNVCHNDGKLVPGLPYNSGAGSYTWGTALADCTACHNNPNSTGNDGARHSKHMTANAAYVPGGCVDCHPAGSGAAGTHLNGTIQATGSNQTGYNAGNGTCTNSCHATSAGVWTDTAAQVCTDCHSGSYIGIAAMPQYAMHTLTPTVSGVVHDATVPGAGGDCAFCHDSMPASGGSHINGSTEGDLANNTDRGMFAGFTDGTTPTCTTACHTTGSDWAYRWSATSGNSDGAECLNCHGGITAGYAPAALAAAVTPNHAANWDGDGTANEVMTAHNLCKTCHGFNSPADVDVNYIIASDHRDGNISMNSGKGYNVADWGCDTAGCHGGAAVNHALADSGLTVELASFTVSGGGCNGCHNDGGSGTWPTDDGAFPYQGGGKHVEHVTAIALAKSIAPDATCVYCHLDPGGSGHDTNNAPAAADVTGIKNLITGVADNNASISGQGTNLVNCSQVDCHFNNTVTPHWYTDLTPPDVRTLTAEQGTEPRSIKVSWLAPGDDAGVDNTTAYVYDMRYSVNDGGADATNFASTTNYVGGLPATYNRNFPSSVVAKNLQAGDTYYFSLRTRDTAGNWSNGSAPSAGIVPTADAQAPDFGGANKAVKGDEGASLNVYWTSAEDHTMPITYKIWMVAAGAGSGTNGALKMGDGTGTDSPDTPLITGWLDSKIELENGKTYNGFGPITINNDTVYQIGIRACDAFGNCDLNNQVVSATPTAVPLVPKTYPTYRTNGSLVLVKDGSAGTEVLDTALPVVFAPAANNTVSVNYFVDTFAAYLNTGNGAATVQATVGYTTDGAVGTFVALGTPKAITLGSRADRVYQFKIVDVGGQNIAIGQRLSILLEETTAIGVKVSYGSTAKRGDVTLAEQFVNAPPTSATNNGTTGIGVGDAIVNINWNASVDGSDGITTDNTIHYDIYGSDDNGLTYDYVIAENYTGPTTLDWDTQTAGIISGTIAVKINAGDGYTHTSTIINNLGSADASDYVAPSPINDLIAKKRPKAGTVWLTWTAPGDDYHNHGRADHYDIRYSTAPITEGNFASATQVTGEPYPDFGGEIQHFEVTGLLPETNYYFAIKTYDENGNGSTISTAKGGGDTTQVGGPRCGMCHTTAPSVDESVGNHKLHGFTLNDCDKCHTPAADSGLADLSPPSSYGLDHQDGKLVMGYGSNGAYEGFISGERIYYTADGTPGGAVLYDDTDGFGGFGDGTYTPVPGTTDPFEAIDSGTCINFGTRLGGACHGSAGTDPDGGGSLPTYETPNWSAAAVLNCAACHGNPNRTNDLYGVPFDATTANAGVVTDQIKGSPIVDNHGNYLDDGTGTEGQRMFIGQHEKHLNYSFRFSKGDSCNLCHPGKYTDKDNIDGRHANGEVEVELDLNAAGDDAVWTKGDTSNPNPAFWTAGTCSSMSPVSCHPTTASPKWDTAQSFDCVGCHGMGGVTPDHITDPNKNIDVDNDLDTGDQMLGNCTWCHFPGHPTDDLGGTAIILANSPQVGINYKSGGIHLRRVIGGRASSATEAELCWGCHDANGISEWGTDTGSNNTATIPANASNYDYGDLYTTLGGAVKTSNWTTGYWSSGQGRLSSDPFWYKRGAIRSTHSTNESGNSAVTGTAYNYTESPDSVDKIRCSNCHDVHNMNKAPGDNPGKLASLDAPPYLRGTWVRNPYPEDGAPWNKTYAAVVADFTTVPRAGGNEMGGYQIDQNNSSPTAGLSLATSAGICTLCHGSDVDAMDRPGEENLWMTSGKNGHSNAAMGGTATASMTTNIFGNGIGGRAVPNAAGTDGAKGTGDIFDMAVQNMYAVLGPTTTQYVYGYRTAKDTVGMNPNQVSQSRSYDSYTWGATVDQTTLDVGYHAFTCSKCHNPHASRLPKLLITNCLDTSHNTWQTSANAGEMQTYWTGSTLDLNEYAATWNTAQNCHRYDRGDNVGGWNKVTPWQ